jgi:hypothetical protein
MIISSVIEETEDPTDDRFPSAFNASTTLASSKNTCMDLGSWYNGRDGENSLETGLQYSNP